MNIKENRKYFKTDAGVLFRSSCRIPAYNDESENNTKKSNSVMLRKENRKKCEKKIITLLIVADAIGCKDRNIKEKVRLHFIKQTRKCMAHYQ